LRHFVALNLRRQAQQLQLESFEVIGPVAQRGNRGGKGRRDGAASKGGKGGPRRP
jgi:short-subunit dehydrogenase involved in D-alanine esterification of teichoic acids